MFGKVHRVKVTIRGLRATVYEVKKNSRYLDDSFVSSKSETIKF